MALATLATTADLSARGITEGSLTVALEVASAAIRDAAGAAIGETTGTITVIAPTSGSFLGLPGPVRAVTAVTVDGDTITDYRNVGNGLWRHCGWATEPVEVTVTGTFGFGEVPADIVDLTCVLAKAWLDHQAAGGGSVAGLTSATLDDARETYSAEAAGQVSPVFIPAATRTWLAGRFGGAALVVETL